MTEEIENPEIISEKIDAITSESNEPMDEIEEAFNNFNISNSEFKPEENQSESNTIDPTEIDLSQAENFKLQIFISLMFTLLDGLHVFIYGFLSKYKITREDIGLDETDKQGLEIYFKTQRVMDLINRLPVEVIGFLHIEYMYFNKFQEFNKKMKETEPEEEEQEEEEQEEEEQETTDEKIQRLLNEKKSKFEIEKKGRDNSEGAGTDTKNVSKKSEQKKSEVKKQAPKKKASPKKAPAKKVSAKKATEEKPTEEKK